MRLAATVVAMTVLAGVAAQGKTPTGRTVTVYSTDSASIYFVCPLAI
jgi:hypothetical protein